MSEVMTARELERSAPVLPRTLELHARRVLDGLHAGRARSAVTGPATEFHDHRAYQPGDDLRSLDWRIAARSDHLLIRRFREERDQPVTIALDSSASMDYGQPSKFAWARLAAAAMGLLAGRQGDRVRVLAGADGCVPAAERSGAAGASAALTSLAALTPGLPGGLAGLLDGVQRALTRRSIVIAFSDALDEPSDIGRALGTLSARGHDVVLIRVLDPSEHTLNADWGLCTLSDPEGRVGERMIDAAATQQRFAEVMRAHRAQLRAVCAAARCDLVEAVTTQAVADVLGSWLHRRGGGSSANGAAG